MLGAEQCNTFLAFEGRVDLLSQFDEYFGVRAK